jgi:hypothetical protein
MTSALDLNRSLPYATEDELLWLTTHARTLPLSAHVLMIGAGPCVMALALLEGNHNILLRVVDNAPMDYCKAHIQAQFPRMLVFYMQGNSREVNFSSKLDFLIVDGSHEYTDVLNDARIWLPRLKVGGMAFFHDYDATDTLFELQTQYPGVKQALNKYLRHQRDKYERVERVGTALIVRRKSE